ncbi:MAG: ABC transporter substrate-binding protein [Myxococcota bacterium]
MTNPIHDDSLTALEPGSASSNRVGRYRLIAMLGRGGMAEVFLAVSEAESTRFQKLLVVKILKPELSAEPDFIEMFLDEARLAARLSHPNVIQTLEVGQDAGRHFLAMEYLEGQPLNRLIQLPEVPSGVDLSARLTILVRALTGLDYAHELADYDGTPLGVVHRDVSPGNILVGYDGQIKLTDFGIAKARDSTTETRVGMFKGKTAYMAPEQAKASVVDRRADIYSAGVVLWELIVGRRMWQGLTQAEIFSRLLAGAIPVASRAGGRNVPPALDRICQKALAHRKEDRYPTAAAFAADLEAFLAANFERKPDREIGRVIAEAYRADRARIRETIEVELSPSARAGSLAPNFALQESSDASGMSSASIGRLSVRPSASPLTLSSAPVSQPISRTLAKTKVLGVTAIALLSALSGALFLRSKRDANAARATEDSALAAAQVQTSSAGTGQQGVTASEVLLGMSAVFSGPTRQLGENMKLGVETAFWRTNRQGGVHGRKVNLVALDDGYEASRVNGTMQELLERRKVFAIVGNVGTPTSVVAAPYASQKKAVFFGAFTGAPVLRQDPPDRYVFNYRASYREETATTIRYLTQVQRIPLDQIVVFAQDDSYGDAGFDGVTKAVRALGGNAQAVLRVGYKRNTVDVDAAIAQIVRYHDRSEAVRNASGAEVTRAVQHPVKAVVMVATYRAASKFIQKMREIPRLGKPLFFNVSFVGTEALADDLKSIAPKLCSNVFITQVVPPFDSGATGVRQYRESLSEYQPQAQPGFVSLEGYIVGSVFVEALKQTGPELTTEKLVNALEQFKGVDLGFGSQLSFSLSEHQGSHKIWGTRLDDNCVVQPADLE